MMTKKDFRLIAHILKAGRLKEATPDILAWTFAAQFKKRYDRFDVDRFLKDASAPKPDFKI
jgi:hypothetical protein